MEAQKSCPKDISRTGILVDVESETLRNRRPNHIGSEHKRMVVVERLQFERDKCKINTRQERVWVVWSGSFSDLQSRFAIVCDEWGGRRAKR